MKKPLIGISGNTLRDTSGAYVDLIRSESGLCPLHRRSRRHSYYYSFYRKFRASKGNHRYR